MIRDLLGITMQVFTCFPEKMNRYDRLAASFPWLLEDGTRDSEEERGGEEADAMENELKKHLRNVEEENSSLKRERNELTKQLLQAREEIAVMRARETHHPSSGTEGTLTASSAASAEETMMMHLGSSSQHDQSVGLPHNLSKSDLLLSGAGEETKELSAKIIELETKLNLLTRKEAEATKARSDAETRNAKLSAEIERCKRLNEELKVNSNTLQVVSDRQATDLQTLQEEVAQKDKQIKALQERVKDYEDLALELQKKQQKIQELE